MRTLSITHAQLIDLGIFVGTDFNDGVKGIGPKKALKLVQQYGTIDLTFGGPDFRTVIDFAATSASSRRSA